MMHLVSFLFAYRNANLFFSLMIQYAVKLFHFFTLLTPNRNGFIVIVSLFLLLTSFNTIHTANKVTKIVIDAGHGGHDTGAIGKFTKEKDLVLKVALQVGKYIEENIEDVKVLYTRKTDNFISLKNRSEVANTNKADLFVSIHANSLPKKTPADKKLRIQGTEVYVMGAQNTGRALNVAKRENSVILLEKDYKKNYDFDPNSEESYILFNLTQAAYQDNSLLLASLIDGEMVNKAGRKSYGVKQSSLYVMWSTAMPSVLVEIGYLSSLQEEKELSKENTQSYIASGIYRAVKQYKQILDSQN